MVFANTLTLEKTRPDPKNLDCEKFGTGACALMSGNLLVILIRPCRLASIADVSHTPATLAQ